MLNSLAENGTEMNNIICQRHHEFVKIELDGKILAVPEKVILLLSKTNGFLID